MANKKVLILSLGRGIEKDGSFNYADASKEAKEKHLKQIIISKESAYKTANYVFEDETKAETNVFIATSLLKREKPDIVFVIGTPGSAWTSFYVNHKSVDEDDSLFSKVKSIFGKNDSYVEKQYNFLRPIWDMEEKNTNDVNGCEPLIQSAIEQLKDDFGVEKIKAIVLPVGKNKEELEWIYSHLNEMIKSELNDDCTYDVAFDITHSFRSIPFYNYAILNYLKQVTDVKLNINKIYYGAFEAKYKLENDKLVTPIIELDKVTNIMNLTNAVSSFNETGSVKGLINLLEKLDNKNDDMIDILTKLEWAIESNNGDAVYDGFVNMVKFINENNSQEVNEYTDILNALKNALSIPFYGGRSLFDIKETKDPIEYSNNQLVLAKWYLSKHRYSQALCIAGENFRSYLACLYSGGSIDFVKEEGKRKRSLDKFKRVIVLEKKSGQNVEFYEKIIDTFSKVNDLRNSSAHNLQNGTTLIEDSNRNNVKIIKDYFILLEEFANLFNDKSSLATLKNMCQKRENKKVKDVAVLYISGDRNINTLSFLRKKYKENIYILPEELSDFFKEGEKISKGKVYEIGKYVEDNFDVNNLYILLNINLGSIVISKLCEMFDYIKVLGINKLNKNNSIDGRPVAKLLFKYDTSPYDRYNSEYFDLKIIKIDSILNEKVEENKQALEPKKITNVDQVMAEEDEKEPLEVNNSNVSNSKAETKMELQKKPEDIDKIKHILIDRSKSISKKIDIIKNKTPNIIFKNVITDIPEKKYIDTVRLLIDDLGFTDKRILDCVHKDKSPRINLDYTLVIKTDPNNQKFKNIIETNYGTITGVKNVDDLKVFIKMIVYYWLIVNEEDKREADNKMMNNYIKGFTRQIILMEGR